MYNEFYHTSSTWACVCCRRLLPMSLGAPGPSDLKIPSQPKCYKKPYTYFFDLRVFLSTCMPATITTKMLQKPNLQFFDFFFSTYTMYTNSAYMSMKIML